MQARDDTARPPQYGVTLSVPLEGTREQSRRPPADIAHMLMTGRDHGVRGGGAPARK